jgi:hypothetical protein
MGLSLFSSSILPTGRTITRPSTSFFPIPSAEPQTQGLFFLFYLTLLSLYISSCYLTWWPSVANTIYQTRPEGLYLLIFSNLLLYVVLAFLGYFVVTFGPRQVIDISKCRYTFHTIILLCCTLVFCGLLLSCTSFCP